MKNKKIILLIFVALSVITLVACTNSSKENQNSTGKTGQNQQVKNNSNKADHIDKTDLPESTNERKENENIQRTNPINTVTKVKGRKEFLERLDDIQKELDALPIKKDSDAGVTNAMRSYYGISYDRYDAALNEIYDLLGEGLSPEIMESLRAEQIKWIKQKEALADEEASQYKGGTFEFVAYNSSLSESTKKRCYELVNDYMTE